MRKIIASLFTVMASLALYADVTVNGVSQDQGSGGGGGGASWWTFPPSSEILIATNAHAANFVVKSEDGIHWYWAPDLDTGGGGLWWTNKPTTAITITTNVFFQGAVLGSMNGTNWLWLNPTNGFTTNGLLGASYIVSITNGMTTNGLVGTALLDTLLVAVSNNVLAIASTNLNGTNIFAGTIRSVQIQDGTLTSNDVADASLSSNELDQATIDLFTAQGAGGGGTPYTNLAYFSGIWPQYISGNNSQVVFSAGEEWCSNVLAFCGGSVTTTISGNMGTVTVWNAFLNFSTLNMASNIHSGCIYWTTGTTSIYNTVTRQWVDPTSTFNRVVGSYVTSDFIPTVTNFITVDRGRTARFIVQASGGTGQGNIRLFQSGNPDGSYQSPNVRDTDLVTPGSAIAVHLWIRVPSSTQVGITASEIVGGTDANVAQYFRLHTAIGGDDETHWLDLGSGRKIKAAATDGATEISMYSLGFEYTK